MYNTAIKLSELPYRLAANDRLAIKATIKRASSRARAELTRIDKKALDDLTQLYQLALQDIQDRIRDNADTGGDVRLSRLQELLVQTNNRLAQLERARNDLLLGNLDDGAKAGAEPFKSAAVSSVFDRIPEDAVRFVQNFVGEDGLQLSDRVWRIDNHAREIVGQAIQSHIIQGHSASEAAADFLTRGEAVPGDIASKMGMASAERIARVLGQALMTGDGNPYSNALRLFRTEINRAHNAAYEAAAFESPDVVGTRFLLSPNHPRPDICDMHASVNRFGLGPGVYPQGKNPYPAHPNTLSFIEVVFTDEITDEDRAGKETRIEWLNRQPAGTQYNVLGSAKKVAALERGVLVEGEIATPWKTLKKRYEKRGLKPEEWAGGTQVPPLPEPPDVKPAAFDDGFVPAASPRAAAIWAMDNNIAAHVDYSGAKVEVANQWNKGVYEHLQEFPELRRNLKFIGTTQARNKIHIQMARQDYIEQILQRNPGMARGEAEQWAKRVVKTPRVNGNVWAISTDNKWTGGISVNSNWAKDPDKFNRYLKLNVQDRFHPVGTDTIKSVVDHELGHQLDDLLNIQGDHDVQIMYLNWKREDRDGEKLSRYARTNIAEFIAEAWSEYRNSAKPREIALKIGGIIKSKYTSKFK